MDDNTNILKLSMSAHPVFSLRTSSNENWHKSFHKILLKICQDMSTFIEIFLFRDYYGKKNLS